MPSDAKKKQQQKKKEAAKARQSGKRPGQSNNQAKTAEDTKEQGSNVQNGTNGRAISAEGREENIPLLPVRRIFIYDYVTLISLSIL